MSYVDQLDLDQHLSDFDQHEQLDQHEHEHDDHDEHADQHPDFDQHKHAHDDELCNLLRRLG